MVNIVNQSGVDVSALLESVKRQQEKEERERGSSSEEDDVGFDLEEEYLYYAELIELLGMCVYVCEYVR